MNHKTKIKVAAAIALIIIAIIFILMIVFVKGNRDIKNNIPTKTPGGSSNTSKTDDNKKNNNKNNISNNDVFALALKNKMLYKLNNNLESELINELSNGSSDETFSDFSYDKNDVYLAYKSDNTTYIYKISNMDGSNNQELVFETDEYNYKNALTVYNDKIYYITEDAKLIEYSISEEVVNVLVNGYELGNGKTFVIDKDKNVLYLMATVLTDDGTETGVYKLDFTSNAVSKIINLDEINGDLILNNNNLIIDVFNMSSVFIYNIDSNLVYSLGNYEYNDIQQKVAFYEDVILYTNGNVVQLKDETGNDIKNDWYEAQDGYIYNISMISNQKLEVVIKNNNAYEALTIDLNSGEISEIEEAYLNVINLK